MKCMDCMNEGVARQGNECAVSECFCTDHPLGRFLQGDILNVRGVDRYVDGLGHLPSLLLLLNTFRIPSCSFISTYTFICCIYFRRLRLPRPCIHLLGTATPGLVRVHACTCDAPLSHCTKCHNSRVILSTSSRMKQMKEKCMIFIIKPAIICYRDHYDLVVISGIYLLY